MKISILIGFILGTASASFAADPLLDGAPEQCWTATGGENVGDGMFYVHFDGKQISAMELAKFIEEARTAADLGIRSINPSVSPFDGSHSIFVVMEVNTVQRPAEYRALVNEAIRNLVKKTPGLRSFTCAHLYGPSTRTGT